MNLDDIIDFVASEREINLRDSGVGRSVRAGSKGNLHLYHVNGIDERVVVRKKNWQSESGVSIFKEKHNRILYWYVFFTVFSKIIIVFNISFFIFHGSQCKLSVYDINGSYLETLLQSYLQSGSYTLAWNAADYAGGIYFIKLDTDFNTHSQKLTLIK